MTVVQELREAMGDLLGDELDPVVEFADDLMLDGVSFLDELDGRWEELTDEQRNFIGRIGFQLLVEDSVGKELPL